MAAGVVAIAHNSGGPRDDIIVPVQGQATGNLCLVSSSGLVNLFLCPFTGVLILSLIHI